MKRMTYRNIQNALLFLTILVLVSAFYFEYIQKLEPCPLCLMQRFCAFLFGFLCLAALGLRTLHRARILAIIQVIITCFGLYFASRQLWLQSLATGQAQVCVPGLDALVNYFSLSVILKAFFWGSHECSEVTWQWLGLSMPGWAAIYFGLMAIANIALAIVLNLTLQKNIESTEPPNKPL
ncbi:MAG: disulfide bond formation protein B [Legionellaceae bacterium]|nr:disulfide bond formation protein B [Legionellaceae bacterium]